MSDGGVDGDGPLRFADVLDELAAIATLVSPDPELALAAARADALIRALRRQFVDDLLTDERIAS